MSRRELHAMLTLSEFEAAALDGFLCPSAASVALAPLLLALYTRQPDVMASALAALTSVAESGFFLSAPLHVAAGAAADGLPDEAEASLVAAAAWALLDAVIASVADACAPLLDTLCVPLFDFFAAALACGGAVDPTSRTLGAAAAADGAGGATAAASALPACGLHPATLARVFSTALADSTFEARDSRNDSAARGGTIDSNRIVCRVHASLKPGAPPVAGGLRAADEPPRGGRRRRGAGGRVGRSD
jgi:hypothetical protein